MKDKKSFFRYEGVNYLLPFILITSCFALWGFANDITNPMVKAFSKIFRMSVTQGTLTQMAFYGGYFAMALPAALFIRRFSYKSGILMGLGLYAAGAFLFIAARSTGSYWPFLIAYFILTCGLSFLETSANPYILAMGKAGSHGQILLLGRGNSAGPEIITRLYTTVQMAFPDPCHGNVTGNNPAHSGESASLDLEDDRTGFVGIGIRVPGSGQRYENGRE